MGHDYSVRRSVRARRLRLTVNEAGEAVVVLPRRATLKEAAMLVEQHGDWLDRHITRVQQDRAALAARPALGEGRVLNVAGESLRVSTVDAVRARPPKGRIEAVPGGLILRLGQDGRSATELLDRWLRSRAREVITDRVQARAQELAVHPARISIRDQSSRWASASRRGTLSFSWRLILAPPYVLDAIVVHELAHLRIRGHDRSFWDIVEHHAPRTPEARQWLRDHRRELHAALD